MQTAAVALSLGWGNPMALLALDPARWQIAVAVIEQAQEIAVKRAKNELEAAAGATASRIVPPLARHITRLVRVLASRG